MYIWRLTKGGIQNIIKFSDCRDFYVFLRIAKAQCPGIETLISNSTTIESQLPLHDVIIGAVLVAGAKAPTLIKKEHLHSMKNGSIFIDIAIDQGGIAETSKATSLNDPVYTKDGVIHYCVPNMPAMVPVSATIALTRETLPWLKELCANNLARKYPGLKKGIVCKNGMLCNKAIADTFGLEWSAP